MVYRPGEGSREIPGYWVWDIRVGTPFSQVIKARCPNLSKCIGGNRTAQDPAAEASLLLRGWRWYSRPPDIPAPQMR